MPDALVDEIALVGDRARMADRLERVAREWRDHARPAGAATGGTAGASGTRGVNEALGEALAAALGSPVTRATQLAGGASKESWAVSTADGRGAPSSVAREAV